MSKKTQKQTSKKQNPMTAAKEERDARAAAAKARKAAEKKQTKAQQLAGLGLKFTEPKAEPKAAALKFTDGVEFDTSGARRVEQRSDGWYVVGGGSLIPVASEEEGQALVVGLAEVVAKNQQQPEQRKAVPAAEQPKAEPKAKRTRAAKAEKPAKPQGPTTDELVAMAAKAGLVITRQSGWTRCTSADGSKAVYVQNATRSVSRVHVAGFDTARLSAKATKRLTEEEAKAMRLGSVRAIIDVGADGWQQDLEQAIEMVASKTVDGFSRARGAKAAS